MQWVIPIVKVLLPLVLGKVFKRNEATMVEFMQLAERVIRETENDNARLGEADRLSGDMVKEIVWSRISRSYPEEAGALSPAERNLLNELILAKVKQPPSIAVAIDTDQAQATFSGLAAAIASIQTKVKVKRATLEIEID